MTLLSSSIPSLNVVGAGRVGQTLAKLFQESGTFQVQALATHHADTARAAQHFVGAGLACTSLEQLPPADVWLLSVPDSQISATAQALAQHAASQPQRPALAFHCSGGLDSHLLRPLQGLGWITASAHPLLSFSQPTTAITQFSGTPCALEGNPQAVQALQPAFTRIGGQCFAIDPEHKLLYHAAAVFATNFLPVLQDVAEQLWQHTGMPPELALQMRHTLLHNAVRNIVSLGPQAALTGPAARGDQALMAAQGEQVGQWNPSAGAAYAALNALAGQLAKR